MKHALLYKKYNYRHLYLIVGCWLLSFSNTFAQISGTVFKDFNNDGFQTPPHELGMRNITVSVYSSSFPTIVKQTDINGNYSFSTQEVPVGSKVRVEFTGLGANNDGKKAGSSNTNVQFLTVPTGGAINIDLGILTNTDYCQVDGTLVYTPCYVNGNALGGGSAGEDDALVSFPYYATGVGGTTGPMPNHIAKASEVGSLWGMDYQARGKTVLTSAITRRHVGLGPLGTGGIYKFDAVTYALSQLIDVKTLGIDTGPDPHTDLPADKLLTSQDAASVDAAGKVGIGGIALSGDEKTLYMVNLYDRKLYSFFVGIPAKTPSSASVKSYAIPNPCGNNDYRPWGVKEYQGNFYLGVVCTNETSQDSTTLSATIYKFNPKTEEFTVFYQFPLTYKRGEADATAACQNIRYWRPWSNTFPVACSSFFDAEYGKIVGSAINPQPLVSDIEFDTDGSMIIGLMDRFGLITGFKAMAPVDDGKLYDGFVSGDILRVYNNNGVYEMENNGQAGLLTGSGVNNDEGFGGGEFYGRDYWEFFGNPAHSEITNGGLMLMPGTGEVLASAMDPVDEVFHAAGFHIYSNTDGSLLRSFAVYAGKKGTLGKSGGVGDMKANCGVAFIEIGNRVWVDINKNGVQDPEENGVGGVTVTLHDMENDGMLVGSTITSPSGEYIFDDSNVSDTIKYEHKYQIRIDMSQDGVKTKDLVNVAPGGNTTLPDEQETPEKMRDSDAKWVKDLPPLANQARQAAASPEGYAVIDFQTGATTLSNHSLDIGLIGCTPPTDVTASSNSPVNQGNTINFTASSTDGITYLWKGPNGFTSTVQNPSIASTTLAASGIYTLTVTGNGTCTATATTSVVFYASMGDHAWYDFNKNGIQDNILSPFGANLGKELPAQGIVMELHKADGTLVGKDTTDANGRYSFNQLLPDSYYVKFDPASYPSVEYAVTGQNSGLNDSLDNDIERVVYKSANFSLASGQNDPNWDIGFFRGSKSTIGDPCTCHDIVYDPDEIYEVLDELIVESTPGGVWAIIEQTGIQKIDSLYDIDIPIGTLLIPDSKKPGKYTLRFAHDVGVGYTVKVTNGVDTLSQSNLCNIPALFTNVPKDTICAFESPIKLSGKMLLNNVDVTNGVIKFYIVKGFENNGTTGNPVYTQITDFNPRDFAPGDTVDIIAEYKPNITTQCPIKKWYRIVIAIKPSCLSQIGDVAWKDVNKNGIQDETGENTFPSISVILLDGNGAVVTKDAYNNSLLGKTTDATGHYEFINLPPGDYMVKFGKPANYTATSKDAVLSTDANDSDADPTTGISQKVTLTKGERNATIDAGFYLTCVPPTLVTASSNSPIEDGGTINLKATATGASSYEWTGPNGFTSNLQNPSLSAANYTRTGTYNVRAKASENCSTMASTFVRVTPPCTIACIPIVAKKIR